MSEDIKVTDGTVLEALNNKVDLDGGNYKGSELEAYIHEHCGGGGLEVGDIGIAPLGLDETQNKRRYLNGQLIIQEQFVDFTQKLKSAVELYPTLACTEEEWQTKATMTVGGQVGKFVVDDEVGTIRLPRIIMPIQGLTDLTSLAEIVDAGSPNITGGLWNGWVVGTQRPSGAVYASSVADAKVAGTTANSSYQAAFGFNASKSNPIYGNSNTVQQEQIQYPYFIQVSTGASESIDTTRATEINNPFFFGQSQYFEATPNNPSWVKSTGTYLSKAVYADYYDWLLTERNNPSTLKTTANVEKYGAVSENDGVLSGFSTSNYAFLPAVPSSIQNYEIVVKFTTGAMNGVQKGILSNGVTNKRTPQINISKSNNISLDHCQDANTWVGVGGIAAQANTTYWVKLVWDGNNAIGYYKTSKTDDWTLILSSPSTAAYWTEKMGIGIDETTLPFDGSIDLKETYININGSRWWTGANGVKQVGTTDVITDYDFAINQVDETFRLPLSTNKVDNANEKLGLYYYIGEGIVNPQLVNVARIEEIKANKTDVDGQWVNKGLILLFSGASTDQLLEIDVSSYLPNDGHKYEVLVYANIKSATGTMTQVWGEGGVDDNCGIIGISGINTSTWAGYSSVLVVGTERKIRFKTTGAVTTTGASIRAYRRLGTNQ